MNSEHTHTETHKTDDSYSFTLIEVKLIQKEARSLHDSPC